MSVPHTAQPARRRRHGGIASRLLTVITSGTMHQSFLGNPAVALMIRAAPQRHRRALALELLAISPHYFTEQASERYAPDMRRREVLERELERNIVSRRRLFDDVIAPYLAPEMTALDLGCGAGILAHEMAKRCRAVIAVDISRGALAAGEALFPLPNLSFRFVRRGRIEGVADGSVDLVTAIAVIQHMTESEFDGALAEIARVLVPGGRALCHVPLEETAAATPNATRHVDRRNPVERLLQRQYGLLMLYRDRDAVERLAARHGLSVESAAVIGSMSAIEDDIAHQQLFVLRRRPAQEAP